MRVAFLAFSLMSSAALAEDGVASRYGHNDGQTTELACPGMGRLKTYSALTAAHPTLPCGTQVMVTNKINGRSVVVTINDRGPFKKGRIIDLTFFASNAIGLGGLGSARVEKVSVLGQR